MYCTDVPFLVQPSWALRDKAFTRNESGGPLQALSPVEKRHLAHELVGAGETAQQVGARQSPP